MLQALLLLNVLQHPVTTHIILVSAGDTEQSSMVRDHGSAEFRNVLVEIYEILRLLLVDDIVEMNVLVSPLEVVDDSPVRQLLLDYEQALEELNDMLLDVYMIVLSDHGLLILQIGLILLDKSLSIINDVPDLFERLHVGLGVRLQSLDLLLQRPVFVHLLG